MLKLSVLLQKTPLSSRSTLERRQSYYSSGNRQQNQNDSQRLPWLGLLEQGGLSHVVEGVWRYFESIGVLHCCLLFAL